MVSITTENLLLKTFQKENVTEEYINALNDYSVVKYTGARNQKWDRAKVERFVLESNVEGKTQLIGIFLKQSTKHIGNIRLHTFDQNHQRVELGIMIFDKTQWSKGYGTEALNAVSKYVFNQLKLHKICADYYSVNQASARMFQKAGFEFEGAYKDHFFLEGKFVDSIRIAKINKFDDKKEIQNKRIIPSAGPSITFKEVELVIDAAAKGWYEKRNDYIDKFVEEFSVFLGRKYYLPTCNCTSAIHLALLSLGIGPGDEVIVPDVTWVASACPIHYIGATPIFADIDEKTWCLSPDSLKERISEKTKAVIAVDLLGGMADMDEIKKIASLHQIPVIEDTAEALGAEYKKQKAGSFGDISVFSFNATKIVIGGQGGLLVTDNPEWFDKSKLLVHHGIDRARDNKYFWSYEIGYNYQWTNMQAAFTLAQFRRLDEMVEKRRQRGKWYREFLKDLDGINFNYDEGDVKNTYWTVTAVLNEKYGITSEEIMDKFVKCNIDPRPFFYPISSMPAYAQYCKGKNMKKLNPVSYGIAPRGICLPSAMSVTQPEVKYVCDCLKKIVLKTP